MPETRKSARSGALLPIPRSGALLPSPTDIRSGAPTQMLPSEIGRLGSLFGNG